MWWMAASVSCCFAIACSMLNALGSQSPPRDRRRGFGHVVDGGERLVSLLKRIGSEAVVDINQALLCHSLDVIGQVGRPSAARKVPAVLWPAAAQHGSCKPGLRAGALCPLQ